MVGLLLRDESSGKAWRVWPDPEAVPPGQVHETGSYLFELHDQAGGADAILLVDDIELEGLRPAGGSVARWRWTPGFHAGTVEAELRIPGDGGRRFEIITDPDRRKLTRDDFDTMVREVLEDTFALFALSSFRQSVARGTGNRPPPLARLEFLRSRIAALEETARVIARSPRRRLVAEEITLPWHRAVRATGPEILQSLRSGRLVRESHGSPTWLPEALQGTLPARIRTRRRQSSLDLPEHRQIAACLRHWAAWLTETAGLLARNAGSGDHEERPALAAWARRCHRLARRVRKLAELPPFAEAGEALPFLTASSLFRRDPAYRRFLQLYNDMHLGIAAVFGDFLGMPLARTFDLYELWCFLRLVRAAVGTYGSAGLEVSDIFISDNSGGVTLAAGSVTVPVGTGWKLCFQREYQEFWNEADGRGSFSRKMKPDIVFASIPASEETPRLIVLDAKYRIDDGLSAALSSIHMYRDALVREADSGHIEGVVTAAYLLSPHRPELKDKYRETDLPGRLFHPEYRKQFCFGAVTLRPGMSLGEIGTALAAVVADATMAGAP
jgi:hypothetical protein